MPDDELGDAFAALSRDAGNARLAAAATVRQRADRQTLTRSVSGVAAAAVLVAGGLLGSRLVLNDAAPPPLPPAQSVTPAPLPSPSLRSAPARPSPPPSTVAAPPAGPSSGPERTTPTTPSVPTSIPARALIGRDDTDGGTVSRSSGITPWPSCADAGNYPSEARAAVRGSVTVYYRSPDAGPDDVVQFVATDTVTVYRGDGAEDFMDEYREPVRGCPTTGYEAATYRKLGPLRLGDESMLIQKLFAARGDDGEPVEPATSYHSYAAAVRIDDAVVAVSVAGWEGQDVDPEDATALIRTAVERYRAWRD